jgi:thiosulfate/3-mercaptopyruvate sulfurtransferase
MRFNSLTSRLLIAVLPFVVATNLRSATAASDDPAARQSMIVSTSWLAEHLKTDPIVLIHVGDKAEYDAGHFPGAQYLAVADISTPRGEGLTLQLPAVEQLETVFRKIGVNDNSRIVIYFGNDWVTPSARVYFTLDYLGLGDRTSILDGGMPAWRGEGRPITSEVKEAKAGTFTSHPKKEIVADVEWLSKQLTNASVAILDARASQFYDGSDPGRMPRAGHIPGAKSIPFSTLVTEPGNKFKSAENLRGIFRSAGAKPGNRVVTYCHTGQQASLLYFAARYLGYDAQLYDGSFEEWSRRSDLQVEGTKPEKKETKPQP